MSLATTDRFTIGGVLGTGFRIWFRNLLPFLIISALIYAPLVIWGIAHAQGDLAAAQQDDTVFWAELALELLANIFVAGALTYGVVMELQGQRASLGACIATGVARFGAVLGVAVLASLAFLAGLVALVVPGIIVYCVLYVATPAAVIERTGALGALRRSQHLTRGNRLRILGAVAVLAIIQLAIGVYIEGVMLDPGITEHALADLRLHRYAELAQAVVFGSLNAVMAAVAYTQLRRDQEGATAAELAAVFA